MRYQVPQFIEVEDKIFGPFTFKQFTYMGGGAGIAFIAYRFLPIYAAVFIIVPALALGAALAFYKMNGRPFIDLLESAFNYLRSSKLYIWKKEERKPEDNVKKEVEDIVAQSTGLYVPKLSDSKLKDLTWSLDINETIYSRESKKMQQGRGMTRQP
ncbi:MAG: PrgI family protein [Patescibacteria group bacterium]